VAAAIATSRSVSGLGLATTGPCATVIDDTELEGICTGATRNPPWG
jgi:hypothetical protein